MDGLNKYALCQVCGKYTSYQPNEIHVGEDGRFFVYCECCMNDIKIEENGND